MNKKYTFEIGVENGRGIAENSFDKLDKQYRFYGFLDNEEIEKFINICANFEVESFRQFSPFEIFARDINECDNSEDLWGSYDDGVLVGIKRAVREYKRNNKSKFKK